MKKMLILTHLSAIFVGSIVGFLIADQNSKQKYAKIAQEEIDSVKEAFNRRYKKSTETLVDLFVTNDAKKKLDVLQVEMAEISEKTKKNLSLIRPNPYEEAKRNYNSIGAYNIVLDGPLSPLVDASGMSEEDHTQPIDRTLPYIIPWDAFSDEFNNHDKLSLYYYAKDGVLCEEAEEVIDDIDGTIGLDNIPADGSMTTFWVRNEMLSSDYEVIILKKSYAEAVHGFVEEQSPKERHKKAATSGRRKKEK